MTREMKLRLKAALEGAFVCTTDPPRFVPTDDAFRVTRAVLRALLYDEYWSSEPEVEEALQALRRRGGICNDAEVLLNCQLEEQPSLPGIEM